MGASIAEDDFQRVMSVLERNIAVAARYRHGRVDTDMLIVAAGDEPERLLNAEMWRPHVGGEIEYHKLPCTHSTITTLIEKRLTA